MHRFPQLAARLSWVTLASLPSPLERASQLERAVGFGPIWVKRDDLCHAEFGGGKPRKLELLLGEALASGHDTVITFGGVGSNQALATAVHGGRLGLRVVLALAAQPPSEDVRLHLAAMLGTGAALRYTAGVQAAEAAACEDSKRRGHAAPWVIPIGGTCPLGNLAFVDAGLELAEQVQRGLAPPPDEIYVAGGTLGTAAGLCLGLKLGRLESRVVIVRASSPSLSSRQMLLRQAGNTVRYARGLDPNFPELVLDADAFIIDPDELGAGYGLATERGRRARELGRTSEGYRLEDTYTAKTLAALLARRPTGVSLFWLTQSATLPPPGHGDAAGLPPPLARYLGS
jgi:D-cysteine desulfhydrase